MYSHNYLNQSKQIWRNIGAESVSTRKISDIKIELKQFIVCFSLRTPAISAPGPVEFFQCRSPVF